MKSETKPRVSIGVPVFNGEKFLRATLDSILGQTFSDLEVIISDNCSTDSTPQICHDYEAKDPRVRYHRNERNLGPAPNYNRCFELARGQYFKWSAADDMIAPNFVARCVEELDRYPSLSGVYPAAIEIDEQGNKLYDHFHEVDLGSKWTAFRLMKYSFCDHRKNHATEFWGLFRSDVLRQWQPTKGSYPSADRLVVTRCALRGRIPRLRERLFLNRSHGNRSQTFLDKLKVRPGSRLVKYIGCGPLPSYEWWDASKKGKIVFPEWKWWWEYVCAVTDSPLPMGTKLACWGVTACLLVKFAPRMARDVLIAGELLINRILGIEPPPPRHSFPKTAGS